MVTQHYVQAATIRWYNACADYSVSLARGLSLLGEKVTFAGGGYALYKAKTASIPTLSTECSGMGFPAMLASCRKFALENKVTLVNTHHGRDHTLWGLALAGTGIPVIRTSGNRIPPKSNPLSKLLIKNTAGIIVSCRMVRDFYCSKFGIEKENIPVINGGVDSEYYQKSGNIERVFPEEKFVFGLIGRFSPDKGHEHFLRAAGEIAKKHPQACFLVAGWDAQLDLKYMEEISREAGIGDSIVFTGKAADSRELIENLDAGVIASVASETICRIAMEYMSMGKPVIATDTNVIPEVVRHGLNGLVVKAGDFRAMAEAMETMLISGQADTFGHNGRQIIEREYSLEAFASRTIEAYRSILS